MKSIAKLVFGRYNNFAIDIINWFISNRTETRQKLTDERDWITMKILILGAGAMGMLFGGYLSQENSVWLLDVDQGRVD